MTSLQLKYAPLTELAAHEENPKAHDVAQIAESLRRFGFIDPVIVDERTGKLAAGHGRLAALTLYRDRWEAGVDGWTEPPQGIRVKGKVWSVPRVVGYSSASDDEARAALVALNRTTELGGWDEEALLPILQALAEGEYGLDGVGYDPSDLDALERRLADVEAPDDFPDVDLETNTECPKCGYEWSE